MFKAYYQRIILAFVIIGVISLGGCKDKTVVITYQPLVNSEFIADSIHLPSLPAGDGKIFRIYCISKIKNTGADAVDFKFDLARIKVGPDDVLVPPHLSYGLLTAQSKLVKAGKTEFNIGTIVIKADVTDEPNEGKYTWRTLNYKSTGEESVLIVQYPSKPSPDYIHTARPTNIPVCYDGKLIPE